MKIEICNGYQYCWHEYEIVLPNDIRYFKTEFGHDMFSIIIKTRDGYRGRLSIEEQHQSNIKFMGKYYDTMKPKDYLMLKNAVELEIALVSLDNNQNQN